MKEYRNTQYLNARWCCYIQQHNLLEPHRPVFFLVLIPMLLADWEQCKKGTVCNFV
jgi:hypothetical protein